MVTVCLATFNGAPYLREQLDSVLLQLSPDDELVVSDDGSTDDTLMILTEYASVDSRIEVYSNKCRRGLVGNFENALAHAKGDHLFLCDQDDVWYPNKLELMLNNLRTSNFVVHDASVVDQQLELIHPSYFGLRSVRAGFWNNLYRSSLLGCCMGFSAESLKLILPFPKGILWHDMWIGLVLQAYYSVKLINTPLLQYRRHGRNLSTASEKSDFSLWYKFYYRLVMLIQVSRRIARLLVNKVIFGKDF